MNTATGKAVLALIRDGDFAHPGEEEAIGLLVSGLRPDPTRRLLDAGCGRGGTAAWLQEHGYGAATGIDVDEETVAEGRRLHPEVELLHGDLQRAATVTGGRFDLIYSMTALYAVADQAAALAQLALLAAPGGALSLLEYSDPNGRFAAATAGRRSFSFWRPLDPTVVGPLLAAAGWRLGTAAGGPGVRDPAPELARWYEELCARIERARPLIEERFGGEWADFVAAEYAAILQLVRDGDLGGLLITARKA
jgi:SAM-dependent methyltransferase